MHFTELNARCDCRWKYYKEVVMFSRYLILAFFAASGGCASLSDYHYNHVAKSRARAAWSSAKVELPAECNNRDFRKGYRDGYLDVSTGGNGACPPVPPTCYWGPSFQDREGLLRVQQWYEGFSRGAHDALQCYKNTWHNVPSVEQVGVCPTQAWMPDNMPIQYEASQAISDPSFETQPLTDSSFPTQLQPIEE